MVAIIFYDFNANIIVEIENTIEEEVELTYAYVKHADKVDTRNDEWVYVPISLPALDRYTVTHTAILNQICGRIENNKARSSRKTLEVRYVLFTKESASKYLICFDSSLHKVFPKESSCPDGFRPASVIENDEK